MRSVKYIIDKATELNMPLSINLSYGTNEGSHDGNSLFETYIDSMAQRWKTVISAATGNEGFAGHHFRGTATAGLMQTVEFSTISNLSSFYLTLWKNFVDSMFFELIGPSGESTGVIRPENAFTFATVDNTEVIIVYGEPTEYSEAQEVFFQLTGRDFAIPAGIWRLNIYPSVIVDGVYDIWLPVIEMVTADTAFRLPDPGITLTLPSTAKNVISVGGYNSLINAMTDFSGRGYTRSIKYVKPDLVAPAVGILSTSAGGGYDAFSGTSIAAPFVTGSSSLLMEWGIIRGNDIYLYGQRIKALLQKGARRRSGITYPNPAWGYGSLCLLDTFNLLT